jgi:hypothetical protein
MALFCVQIDYFAMNLALPRRAAGHAIELAYGIAGLGNAAGPSAVCSPRRSAGGGSSGCSSRWR